MNTALRCMICGYSPNDEVGMKSLELECPDRDFFATSGREVGKVCPACDGKGILQGGDHREYRKGDTLMVVFMREDLEKARECLSFFKSVIQSGEQWTETCQKAFDNVMGKKV